MTHAALKIAFAFLGIAAVSVVFATRVEPSLGMYEDACFDPEEVEPRARSKESVFCHHPNATIKAQREAEHSWLLKESDRIWAERSTLDRARDECRWQVKRCNPRLRCWHCGGLERVVDDLLECAKRRGDSEAWQRQARLLEMEIRRLDRAREVVGERQSRLGELGWCDY